MKGNYKSMSRTAVACVDRTLLFKTQSFKLVESQVTKAQNTRLNPKVIFLTCHYKLPVVGFQLDSPQESTFRTSPMKTQPTDKYLDVFTVDWNWIAEQTWLTIWRECTMITGTHLKFTRSASYKIINLLHYLLIYLSNKQGYYTKCF